MSPWWEANLAALGTRREPGCAWLAGELGRRGPGADLGLRSRSGRVLPGIGGNRPRALVSVFDPHREAERWAEGAPGTLVVWGAGGPDLARALDARGVRLQFWVEPRIEVWQSLFAWDDWTSPLDNPGWVPVAVPAAQWGPWLLRRYHPAWDGGFVAREWRAAVQGEEALWDPYREETLKALDDLTSDASTQARFAERWYRNSLINLQTLEDSAVPFRPGSGVVVAGAGPSLADSAASPEGKNWLAARVETGNRLFAADTALPALTARGIVPDVVFCLDGQLPSYHHFVDQPPPVPLVADLASLPLLGRRGMPVVRYLSGHPFGAVVRRFFPELPELDGSSGNVSGLARQTARALGAGEVRTWGVDFAYRNGQSYARGSYVYDLASRRSTRLGPLETKLGAACYGAPGRERTERDGWAWDTTPLLRDYRSRWESAPPPPGPIDLRNQATGSRWEAFRDHWATRVRALPFPPKTMSMTAFVPGLEPSVQEDWKALWPLALALEKQGRGGLALAEAVAARALDFLTP